MMRLVSAILGVLALATAARAQDVPLVSTQAALNHVNQRAVVCGKVASVKTVDDKSLVIALDVPYPGQLFAFQILPPDLSKFGTPALSLPEKRVCGTGVIAVAQGKAQMILKEPGQLTLQQP